MAKLDTNGRKHTVREAVKKLFVETGATANFDTDELQAAVDATDDWIDANAASYVASLPDGRFKSSGTAEQKTILFAYVAFKRAGLI